MVTGEPSPLVTTSMRVLPSRVSSCIRRSHATPVPPPTGGTRSRRSAHEARGGSSRQPFYRETRCDPPSP
jgi:hypothetical protein